MGKRSVSRPWFFRRWFLQLAFVIFWPTWGILIIRSPWHRTLRWKVVAWLHFIVSAWFWLMAIEGLTQSLIFLVPGLVVVVVASFQWNQVRAVSKASMESDRVGTANLPLHGGKEPRWLYQRMVKLARAAMHRERWLC